MTNAKLTQLIAELNQELCEVNEDIDTWEKLGLDPSENGNYDDAFYIGVKEGELYERSKVLSRVLMRLRGIIQ